MKVVSTQTVNGRVKAVAQIDSVSRHFQPRSQKQAGEQVGSQPGENTDHGWPHHSAIRVSGDVGCEWNDGD
jgi:hypothetical protein